MATKILTASPRRPASPLGFWQRLGSALTLHRSRQGLLKLDDHLLRDIGISRDEAVAEANRPSWDVPSHWRG